MVEYEFTEEQNSVITSLAITVTLVGVVNIVGAMVLWLKFAQSSNFSFLINGTVTLIMALAFIFPMQDLTKVVRSEGTDITDLRNAFKSLNKLWVIFIIGYGYLRVYQYFQVI